jgi:hypothetical protein
VTVRVKKVMADDVVYGFHPEHSHRLAAYWAEALGGPATYSDSYGGETSAVRMHGGNGPHEEMDRRAIACFDQALADIGLAGDDRHVRCGTTTSPGRPPPRCPDTTAPQLTSQPGSASRSRRETSGVRPKEASPVMRPARVTADGACARTEYVLYVVAARMAMPTLAMAAPASCTREGRSWSMTAPRAIVARGYSEASTETMLRAPCRVALANAVSATRSLSPIATTMATTSTDGDECRLERGRRAEISTETALVRSRASRRRLMMTVVANRRQAVAAPPARTAPMVHHVPALLDVPIKVRTLPAPNAAPRETHAAVSPSRREPRWCVGFQDAPAAPESAQMMPIAMTASRRSPLAMPTATGTRALRAAIGAITIDELRRRAR